MVATLKQFKVVGLHGTQTMDVHLQDNKLILVGENGTGKSTFVNLMYHFLTKQWKRLRGTKFARLEAALGDEYLVVSWEDLEEHISETEHAQLFLSRSRHVPPGRLRHQLALHLMHYAAGDTNEDEDHFARRVSDALDLSPRLVRDALHAYTSEADVRDTKLQRVDQALSTLAQGQFLYLPTYRRIEQDLRSIFRGVPLETELRNFRSRLEHRKGARSIDLVEFGMEDVEQTIESRMSELKESVRNGLNVLTGTYLREILRGVHHDVDVQQVRKIEPATLNAIFARIDEPTLSTLDKSHLKDRVASISSSDEITNEDRVIAHFLQKLIEFYKQQQETERPVREFARICTQYLAGKRILYDSANYGLRVEASRPSDGTRDTLELKMLSSGEKQIVSLFSHLYLSGEQQFFVVIDEPELSLSVPWQRKFLPDILDTGLCTGLVAVTHSPFVFDNDLERYVRSLAEFTTPYRPPPKSAQLTIG